MHTKTTIFLTIPLMNEGENIPTLLDDLRQQTVKNFKVICCVNQPESWWDDPRKMSICENNQATIKMLQNVSGQDVVIVDRSSPGNGWAGKHFGVGWARKTAMDAASESAGPDDVIVTMDGDTRYRPDYLENILKAFSKDPEIKALAAQYYHKLTGNEAEDRAILRYEIYMRYFSLNMLRIGNPYAFTAIGSAMACTAKAYRGIRGITPHKSGEDFYFIQKLRKYGEVKISSGAIAYPAARFSDRVFFGTGPAMIRGNDGDWSGYPIYPHRLFDLVAETFSNFPHLYRADIALPMSEFLFEKFGKEIWEDLRRNAKTVENFVRACRQKVDGLRILQFLKSMHQDSATPDELNLKAFFGEFYPDEEITVELLHADYRFDNCSVDQLDKLRNFLFEKENIWRKQINILR